MDTNAATAFARFGLGRRRDEPVPDNPKAWLRAQLDAPDTAPGGASTADALALVWAVILSNKAMAGDADKKELAAQDPARQAMHAHVQGELNGLIGNAIVTEAPFRERLVWFWANHFNISARTRPAAACAGPFVREAIRPHVTGRFSDMVLAVMRHPAMLTYLDQFNSLGPDSIAGQRRHKGLNENLARECLELHTVSPASGYTQADVTAFARVLTGWSIEMMDDPRGFKYRPNAHEPGEQTVMGQSWPDGEAGGVALLTWLADHPYTHRHLAEKLVRHFVADDPPAHDVAVIEAVLRQTGGDLGAASRALIDLPGAWTPLTKLRTPQDYVIATMRAAGTDPAREPHLPGIMLGLGQGVFEAPFPIGWPDRAADWAGPEAVLQRIDFAYQFAGRTTGLDPMTVAQDTLGPHLGAETLAQIGRAGSRRDALTLLLASPEFQRR